MTLQHTTLETRREDIDAEVAFWALIGFEQVEPPGRLRDIATWVARNGTQIHLLYTDEPVIAPRGHVAVVADDYDATLQRLDRAGFAFEPTTADWGAPRGFARSPAGHRVEVMQAPPPS
ncbi:MAG: Glyoxalase-like domain [Solirubrobacteraceae bacterium]|jgi:catechol 2,3-dioxygenase-like lactoylglutathione lyase family enzyme|nr:Glyoxalase-like domain [Solirubrobacteraceae bacterium]